MARSVDRSRPHTEDSFHRRAMRDHHEERLELNSSSFMEINYSRC